MISRVTHPHTGSVIDEQASWRMALGPQETVRLRCSPPLGDLDSSPSHFTFDPAPNIDRRLLSFTVYYTGNSENKNDLSVNPQGRFYFEKKKE